MFRVAGKKVAVANAAVELKAMAHVVIDCNDNDSVAKYLLQVNK